MTTEISAPAPASNTSVKPATRAQSAQPAGETPAVSFLSLLGAMGLGTTDAAVALPESAIADAEAEPYGRLGADLGQGDDPSQATLAQLPMAADWWAAVTPSGAAAGLAGHARGAGQGSGPGLTAASPRAMESTSLALADSALSNPSTRLNATSELQQLPAHALIEQPDGESTPASARDFMARADAARMAAEPDTATLRAANATVGGTPSLGQVVSLFDAAAAGLHAVGAQRNQERNQSRTAGTGSAQGLVAWGDATPAGTQHGASSVYAPGALTPAPATAMAEKVHYWVSRGVQSASLQLDAFAGGSVDVSIAVKGDEAVVEFRTDQPQARQLLLEAMPHLKELLASEGLMLSGGFVGSSAQQQGGQSQGRSKPQSSAGEALVGAPQAAQDRARVPGGLSGSRVDLFA